MGRPSSQNGPLKPRDCGRSTVASWPWMTSRSASRTVRSLAFSDRTAPVRRRRSKSYSVSPPRRVVARVSWIGPVGDRAARRHVGYLPEHFRFPDWLTGSEFVDVHGRLAGLSRAERRERVPGVLATVGLTEAADKQLRTYSKGMQQRVGLAQAIVHRPTLVFLDEPTSALDPLGRRDVRNLISRLRGEGVTVFLNSHLLSEVELVCDRVAIVNHGRVVRSGALADLLAGEHVLRLTVDSATAELVATLRAWGTVECLDERVTTPKAQGGRSPLVLPARQELRIVTSGPAVAPAIAAAVVAQGSPVVRLDPRAALPRGSLSRCSRRSR